MARVTRSITRRRRETFPWDKLPAELRLLIYRFIIPENEIDTFSRFGSLNQCEEAVSILHLNAAIRAEALQEIWKKKRFYFILDDVPTPTNKTIGYPDTTTVARLPQPYVDIHALITDIRLSDFPHHRCHGAGEYEGDSSLQDLFPALKRLTVETHSNLCINPYSSPEAFLDAPGIQWLRRIRGLEHFEIGGPEDPICLGCAYVPERVKGLEDAKRMLKEKVTGTVEDQEEEDDELSEPMESWELEELEEDEED